MNSALKCIIGVILVMPAQANGQETQGPFGTTMGMSLEAIHSKIPAKAVSNVDNGVLLSTEAPNSIEILDGGYYFLTTEKTGLCRAVGAAKKTTSESDALSTYDILKKALTEKYGKPTVFEKKTNKHLNLIPALAMERGLHSASWDLPGDLKFIGVEIQGLDYSTARVRVMYDFKNIDECQKIINRRKTQGL